MDDDYEDGEIFEEGEEVETPKAPQNGHKSVAVPPSVDSTTTPEMHKNGAAPGGGLLPLPQVAPRSTVEPLLPTPPVKPSVPSVPSYKSSSNINVHKRPYSEVDSGSSHSNSRHGHQHHHHPRYEQPPAAAITAPQEPSGGGAPPPLKQPRRDGADPRDAAAERYAEGVITRFPRQVAASNVLLNFSTWVEALTSRMRKRLDIDDLRDIVLNIMDKKSTVSPFLMESLFPHKAPPTKVCIVLLGNLHPAVLQRFRPDLKFFDGCTSIPCTLMNANQERRREAPLPQLLYQFPKPPVDTKDLSVEELFYGHELTFLMVHSLGYNDEVNLLPSGKFARKSQPQGGDWELDGDLLHLKWRQQRNKADEADGTVDLQEEEEECILDVLVAEDASMHYFATDATTDAVYARDTPDHLMSNRQRAEADTAKPRHIRLSLIKATSANVPRDDSGAIVRANKTKDEAAVKVASSSASCPSDGDETMAEEEAETFFDLSKLTEKDFEPFIQSQDELEHHLFPVDVEQEQRMLQKETHHATRDVYVKTQPRPAAPAETSAITTTTTTPVAHVYALDCEMCETDLGMELTRVTVVDVHGVVVYDQLVKPQNTIINYHTQYSGITEASLASTRHILADVQRELLEKFLFEDTILVGHSLTSDLRALRIVHLKIADTSVLYPHQRGFPFRPSLKLLTKMYLGKDIQTKLQDGHDSAEDARAAMELLIQKMKRGVMYGIPELSFSSSAYDTLPDKLYARKKRMTMLKYDHKLSGEWVYEEKQPWELYASGHLQLAAQNPADHAAAVRAKQEEKEITISSKEEEDQAEEKEDHETVSHVSHAGFDAAELVQSVRAASTRGDDLCWLEINQVSDPAASKEFLLHHDKWMDRQRVYCQQIDELLCRVRDEAIATTTSEGEGTLMIVVPQGDLGVLRYVKALQLRSRWKDVTPEKELTNELKAAMSDAFSGALDGCVFFTQK